MFLRRRAGCPSRGMAVTWWFLVSSLAFFASPVRGQDGGEYCNICGQGGVIGSPDQAIQEPILGTDTTCAELQDQADQNTFTSLQCTIIQFAIAAPCACEIPTTPSGPAAAPAGTRTPTSPAGEPTVSPAAPSPSPVFANVTTKIIIELSSVTGRMNPNVTAVYERETCDFLSSSSSVDATNLKCKMLEQALSNMTGSSSSSSGGRRRLQDKPAIYMLATLLQVSARESSLSSENLGLELASTIDGDPTVYLDSLTLPFFDTVTDVSAFAASDAPSAVPEAPSEAPVTGTSSPNAATAPTDAPSVEGTGSPTSAPILPTGPPTDNPSPAPVAATRTPTYMPREPVAGLVSIQLEYVVGQMNDALAADFERQTDAYLTEELASADPPVSDLKSTLRRQVAGDSVPPSDLKPLLAVVEVVGTSSTSGDISQVVADAINADPDAYLETLKSSGSAPIQIYLKSVENVTAQPFQESKAPVAAPTAAPGPEPSSSGLSSGAIAGIVIGVVLGVPLILYLLYRLWGDNSKQSGLVPIGSNDTGSAGADAMARNSSAPMYRSSTNNANTATVAAAPAAVPVRSSIRPSRRLEEAPSPPSKSSNDDEDEESMQRGLNEGATTSMAPTEDNGSYAYSMDAEEAIGPTATDVSTADTSLAGGTSVGASGGTTGAGSSTVSSDEVKTRKYKRIVVAPAGKLGIVIDTTLEGPVVYKVNEGSPLAGVIFPGDLIASIDDVETRAMSASNITTLMVQTAGQKRTLTVLSDDPNR